jgi:hypothetical protein
MSAIGQKRTLEDCIERRINYTTALGIGDVSDVYVR